MARRMVSSNEMLRLNPALAWREFEGEFVAYDEASGNSFLVSGMAARIFAALRDRSVAKSELAGRFCPAATADPPADAAEVFGASLGFLEELEAILPGASN
ncbi:MAG TPA: HPr-rel-A system PqqD family peptide chaperone [Stellaceae bacterium]|jgi:PqqD family protein of HPr-rel-A system|nr:HPr-rel-A system PqqD family peptide chaperone [Stellaceae bacterium]